MRVASITDGREYLVVVWAVRARAAYHAPDAVFEGYVAVGGHGVHPNLLNWPRPGLYCGQSVQVTWHMSLALKNTGKSPVNSARRPQWLQSSRFITHHPNIL